MPARKIDAEVSAILLKSYAVAQQVLNENIEILHKLADLLLEKETVMGEELDDLIRSVKSDFNPTVKKSEEFAPEEETASEEDAAAQEKMEDESSPAKDDNGEE